MPSLLLLIRLALGAVFAFSGWQKVTAPVQNFEAVIEGFRVISGGPAFFLAATLPWVELILGIFLFLGLWSRVSHATLWAMNTVFLGVLASALLRNLPIKECGCFGEVLSLSLPRILAVDAALWAFFLLLFVFSKKHPPACLDDFLKK